MTPQEKLNEVVHRYADDVADGVWRDHQCIKDRGWLISRVEQLERSQRILFDAMKNADPQHQNWLAKALADHFISFETMP